MQAYRTASIRTIAGNENSPRPPRDAIHPLGHASKSNIPKSYAFERGFARTLAFILSGFLEGPRLIGKRQRAPGERSMLRQGDVSLVHKSKIRNDQIVKYAYSVHICPMCYNSDIRLRGGASEGVCP